MIAASVAGGCGREGEEADVDSARAARERDAAFDAAERTILESGPPLTTEANAAVTSPDNSTRAAGDSSSVQAINAH